MSDTAKNVTIHLHNATPDEIKVTKFEYYDYDDAKYRTESMFPVDGFQKIEHNATWSKTRDLEHIKDDKTKFKVTWQRHIGGTSWGSDQTTKTDDFTCHSDMSKQVDIS
jgi:hypothetical protein